MEVLEMESNFNLAYKDTAPAKPLTKAVLNKMVWRSLNLQASFNFERMQAAGWLWGIYQVWKPSTQTRMTYPHP